MLRLPAPVKKAEKDVETVKMSAREINDSAAKATNVHRAMRIRIENRKMLLQKTQSQQKKISLAVLIEDTLMLAVRKKKMTGKSFLKIKSRISVKKDGLAENLRRNKYEASIIRRFVHY